MLGIIHAREERPKECTDREKDKKNTKREQKKANNSIKLFERDIVIDNTIRKSFFSKDREK